MFISKNPYRDFWFLIFGSFIVLDFGETMKEDYSLLPVFLLSNYVKYMFFV